jgi:hypothetical protein
MCVSIDQRILAEPVLLVLRERECELDSAGWFEVLTFDSVLQVG